MLFLISSFQRDFQNFLESCIDTVENELTVDAFHDSDTGCSDFNYIYQGLSSLQGLKLFFQHLNFSLLVYANGA